MSVTEIRSRPEGATVRIDGIPRGTTPFMWHEHVTDFTRHRIELEVPGYRRLEARIGATQVNWAKVGASIISLPPLSLVGFIAVTDYPMFYDFALAPGQGPAAPANAASAQPAAPSGPAATEPAVTTMASPRPASEATSTSSATRRQSR